MALRPIEEVRGTALRADPPALVLPQSVVLPDPHGRPIRSLTLEPRPGRAIWVARFADNGARRADAATGAWLGPLSPAEAQALGRAAYRGTAAVSGLALSAASNPPLDLRQPRPAWQVAFADGTHVYIDADTGATLALRTAQWRGYDWMWGLHVMDLGGREDTSHAILIGTAAIALLTVLLALVLLPMVSRRRR
jgi:hypothetical protein